MSLLQKELEFWLASLPAIGAIKIQELLKYFKTEEQIFKAGENELRQVSRITEKDVACIISNRNIDTIKRKYEKMYQQGNRIISVHDKAYPEKLKNIVSYPYALFLRGNLPSEKKISIAIVGARNCTAYGKEVAKWYARELAKAGIQVISGMAYGVDSYAHKGAIEGNADTYAVLGCGIDICYPRENFELYMHMSKQGGVISEYGPGVPGRAFQFPLRNRIISGLSDGILVVEARERSGSLITADLALEQGKDIFAIPGRIGDKLSEGCLNLIKEGATPVVSPIDIIENFHINMLLEQKGRKQEKVRLSAKEQKIYDCVTLEEKHISTILSESKMIMAEALSLLVKLEMRGVIRQSVKNYYIRCY